MKCENLLQKVDKVREENHKLTNVIETLKRINEKTEEERLEKEEHLEKEWGRKIGEMKSLYETAIHGYKEELAKSESKLRSLIQFYEAKESEYNEIIGEKSKNSQLEGRVTEIIFKS